MPMVAIRTVNGTAPVIEPTQNGYKIMKSDLYSDSTGRSAETGMMLQYIIRSNVVSIELRYEGTEHEIGAIESLYSAQKLTVCYRDDINETETANNVTTEVKYYTKDFYPSDRVKDIESLRDKGRVVFSVSLIEI